MLRISLLFCVLASTTMGCAQGDRTPTAPVRGTVLLDGTPVEQGTITFESEGSRPATGKIADGQIVEVTTYEPGDGVPIGEHRVTIQVVSPDGQIDMSSYDNPGSEPKFVGNYMGGQSLIPERYGNPATSGLTASVERGGVEVQFEISSR